MQYIDITVLPVSSFYDVFDDVAYPVSYGSS